MKSAVSIPAMPACSSSKPGILPGFPPGLSAKAHRQLERLGVEIRTGVPVADVDARGIRIGEERILCRTIIGAAGVTGLAPGRDTGG